MPNDELHTLIGPVLLLAGPGTGKTYQIAKRVRYLIVEEKVPPDSITVITFTNVAAQNMITRCLQVIVSDFTELYYQDKKAYLCVHMDIYGKMIYGWQLLTSPNSELVVRSWKKALIMIKRLTGSSIKDMVIHQDRGSVYTGAEYISAVLKEKVRLSYSRRGEPGDNAVNEAFFSRLKEEWRDVFIEARSFDELQKMVRKAIDYYNNERYHSAIGLKAPLAFTKEQVGHLALH